MEETSLEFDGHQKPLRFSPLIRQILAASGPIIAIIAGGLGMGYSAVLLPQIQHANSSIPTTVDEGTWIASILTFPIAVGCLLGIYTMENFGRWKAMIIPCVIFFVGWILLALANGHAMLLLGRFLTGISSGLLAPPISVFIGEVSDPKYRGTILAFVSLALASGILVCHAIGTFLHWKITAGICALFPLASLMLISVIPESPSYLLTIGKVNLAEKAFKWYRGTGNDATEEFQSMVQKQTESPETGSYSWHIFKTNVVKPEFKKPLIIMLLFFVIMQFSGGNVIAFYSVQIMKDTIGAEIDEYLATIVLDVVRLLMSIAACVFLTKYGRRPLALLSGVGTSACLIGLTIFLYLSSKNENLKQMAWLPLTLLIAYICFISVGIFPLPWCMIGEVFPIALRGLGSGITSAWNFVIFFIVVKTGPDFFAGVGAVGAFLIYGCVMIAGTIYLYYFLPETMNKTLQQIEEEFSRNERSSKRFKSGIVGTSDS